MSNYPHNITLGPSIRREEPRSAAELRNTQLYKDVVNGLAALQLAQQRKAIEEASRYKGAATKSRKGGIRGSKATRWKTK